MSTPKSKKKIKNKTVLHNYSRHAFCGHFGRIFIWLCRKPSYRRAFTAATVGAGMCVLALLTNFLMLNWTTDRAHRAVFATISAMGTSPLNVVLSFGLLPVIMAVKNRSFRHLKNGPNLRKELLRSIGLALLVWFCVFLYELPRPVYNASEIGEFGGGVVVATLSAGGTHLMSTGFWINNKGDMATCLPSGTDRGDLIAGSILPPMQTKSQLVSSGIIKSSGQLSFYDSETCISVIRVDADPFTRASQGLSWLVGNENPATHRVTSERTETYFVPTLFAELSRVGDRLFMTALEPQSNSVPALATLEGSVTRLEVRTSTKGDFWRIYTSIPFKREYIGAPMFNSSENVVAMVSMESAQYVVAIPAVYVAEAIRSIPK